MRPQEAVVLKKGKPKILSLEERKALDIDLQLGISRSIGLARQIMTLLSKKVHTSST